MTILFTILSIIAGIIVLLLLIALFAPKAYHVKRSITINRPVAPVFDYLKHIKNQDNYSKWVMTDPGMRRTFKGEDGTEGFSYAWDSDHKKAGKGEQIIKKIDEGKRVDLHVVFIKPFSGVSDMYTATTAQTADSTSVEWGVDSIMPYPMNLMLVFLNMDKMLGNDMDISLNNLKRILEKE